LSVLTRRVGSGGIAQEGGIGRWLDEQIISDTLLPFPSIPLREGSDMPQRARLAVRRYALLFFGVRRRSESLPDPFLLECPELGRRDLVGREAGEYRLVHAALRDLLVVKEHRDRAALRQTAAIVLEFDAHVLLPGGRGSELVGVGPLGRTEIRPLI
jgi:hypothetical protein